MNEQIIQIAQRLRGLREVLDLSTEDFANECGIPVEEYKKAESGQEDISIGMLQKVARQYNVSLDTLMFGEEPKINRYFITRAGKGTSIERTKAYKYQALASGFRDHIADPFIVTIEPKPDGHPFHLNKHVGQEFNMVIEGRMEICIDDNIITLDKGDSIYYNAQLPHGMRALDGKTLKMLAVIM
jgi:transcriptional regulator with XRE-family HTH domain